MDGEVAMDFLSTYTRINISAFGAWPRQKNKNLSKTLFFLCLSTLLIGCFLPQTFQVLQVWKNFELLSKVLCTAELTIVIAITKMIVLYYKKKKMTILFDIMIGHWTKKKNKEELKIMQKNGYHGKKFSLICIILPYSTVQCRLFQWILENMSNWNNQDGNNFTLYVEAHYPFNWSYTPIFEITCFLQYAGVLCATFANSGADSFFSQIIFHFIGQYQILRLKLAALIKNIENNMPEFEFNKEFKNIVYIHHHINSCIEMLESCFYLTFLIQLLACSFQFCLQAYLFVMILTEENSNSSVLPAIMFIVIYFVYQTTTFYIFCHLAEMLQMESFYFAQTAYESKWYNLPPHKSKCLLLLMQSGYKPIPITAGKFFVLNFMLFGSILRTSMGYLSFLITMKESNK